MKGIEGFDCSRFNGPTDWNSLAEAGAKWCYIQGCRDVNSPDPQCLNNINEAIENDLMFGVYQRVFPKNGTPEDHARSLVRVWMDICHLAPRDELLPFCVDYEEQDAFGGAEWCLRWMTYLNQATGAQCFVVYAPGSMFGNQIAWDLLETPDVFGWVADTGKFTGATPGNPKAKHPKFIAHQYSHTELYQGKPVDRNISMNMFPVGGF